MNTFNTKIRLTWLFLLVSAGLLFSGYLSAIKLFTGSCALGETCPYFLGYPACWYGFAMYLGMFVTTILGIRKKIKHAGAFVADMIISGLGVAFSGNFVMQELWRSRITGVLGLSTCVYGLIFYLAIFAVSLYSLKCISESFHDHE